MATKYSTGFPAPGQFQDQSQRRAKMRMVRSTAEVSGDESDGDTVMVAKIPNEARVSRLASLRHDALTAGVAHLGTTADPDAFMASQSLATAGTKTPVTAKGPGDLDVPVWKAGGFTSPPSGGFTELILTWTTAPTAEGKMDFEFPITQGE